MASPRENTIKLLDLIENGILDKDKVINDCLSYMSEADVADMARLNDYFYDGEDSEEEED